MLQKTRRSKVIAFQTCLFFSLSLFLISFPVSLMAAKNAYTAKNVEGDAKYVYYREEGGKMIAIVAPLEEGKPIPSDCIVCAEKGALAELEGDNGEKIVVSNGEARDLKTNEKVSQVVVKVAEGAVAVKGAGMIDVNGKKVSLKEGSVFLPKETYVTLNPCSLVQQLMPVPLDKPEVARMFKEIGFTPPPSGVVPGGDDAASSPGAQEEGTPGVDTYNKADLNPPAIDTKGPSEESPTCSSPPC